MMGRQSRQMAMVFVDMASLIPEMCIRDSSSGKVKNSENSVLGEMLAALGCVNIADSDASLLEELSMEAILAAEMCIRDRLCGDGARPRLSRLGGRRLYGPLPGRREPG